MLTWLALSLAFAFGWMCCALLRNARERTRRWPLR